MSSSSWALSANSSERGMVWMMSSISWPGWLGSRWAIASASLTRREISGISSTLAFIAATVNRPTKRCSIAWPSPGRTVSRTTTMYGYAP